MKLSMDRAGLAGPLADLAATLVEGAFPTVEGDEFLDACQDKRDCRFRRA